ncbi:hypothetical protein HanRHA438_Chr05g0234011 [Helianthus annuus]|nr:hypothetical protein HanIR_Chr13g0647631 [Helianthus annuus]KAJ0494799.1 hypothetical protein HanIR_Chr12g0601541 [Helianthus annuus]KAJ0509603.1 hypothetical protein HanIR_Chr11g0530821 [Helianthus annuus]KAJ0588408.1 hypothetical protein HanIR_Chr04g0174311 [Helianthus annuus]KAJ0588712.1 hypothetical protein HanIR_Chr04g0177851 [Helianthus annuus]
MNLCKSIFTCKIVFKTCRSMYLQVVFSKDQASKGTTCSKPDLTQTKVIFVNKQVYGHLCNKSFNKEIIFVKTD